MESNHWYVPGKTVVERQHINEHGDQLGQRLWTNNQYFGPTIPY